MSALLLRCARQVGLVAICAVLPLVLVTPTTAAACGAFYASPDFNVVPNQKIVVVHRAGLETYVFRPQFCGQATEFGLILPLPAPLTSPPTLAAPELYADLDHYTAPEVVEVCRERNISLGCGAVPESAGAASEGDVFASGVDVVERGRVGDFEYALLQATSVAVFGDWLDQNGFPHDPSNVSLYEPYVAENWYFVAFKVSADAPPAADGGQRLCGELGPIELSFNSLQPIVPARIASVNGDQSRLWRIYFIADREQSLVKLSPYESERYFSRRLLVNELARYPRLAALSRDGERLTVLDIKFPSRRVASEIVTQQSATESDFRKVHTVYAYCDGGCASGAGPSQLVAGGLVIGALLTLRRPGARRKRFARSEPS